MKTILVVYTNGIGNKEDLSRKKKYAFNTKDEISIGDLISSKEYESLMKVVNVLPTKYEYINIATGELSDIIKSTNDFAIRELVITEDTETVIYGKKVNNN